MAQTQKTYVVLTIGKCQTIEQLFNIAHLGRFNPSIDADYFSNTPASNFWSASPIAINSSSAQQFHFNNGNDSNLNRSFFTNRVRCALDSDFYFFIDKPRFLQLNFDLSPAYTTNNFTGKAYDIE